MKLMGKCPNVMFNNSREPYPCSYAGYIVRQKGIFAKDSGLDTEGCLVECRQCHHIYFLFPPVKSKILESPQIEQ